MQFILELTYRRRPVFTGLTCLAIAAAADASFHYEGTALRRLLVAKVDF